MSAERLREIDLHLTNRCNLVCAHCSVDSGPGRSVWSEMPVERWFEVIDEAAALGCRYADLTGGEPVLYAGVERIIDRVLATGMHLELQSNGILLTADRLRRLRDAGLATLVISLDGDAAQHDRMRGRAGAYAAAMRAIGEAIELGFQVRVTRVFDDADPALPVEAFAAELDRVGVSYLSVNLFSPVTRRHITKWRKPSPENWLAITDRLERLAAVVSYPISYEVGYARPDEMAELLAEETRCLIERRRWFLVRSDGEVYPCYHFVHRPEMSLGNVRERPLSAVAGDAGPGWSAYAGLSRLPSGCSGCDFSSTCGGGCPSPGYLTLQSLSVRDPRCAVEEGYLPVCPFVKRRAGTRHVTNIAPYYAGGSP